MLHKWRKLTKSNSRTAKLDIQFRRKSIYRRTWRMFRTICYSDPWPSPGSYHNLLFRPPHPKVGGNIVENRIIAPSKIIWSFASLRERMLLILSQGKRGEQWTYMDVVEIPGFWWWWGMNGSRVVSGVSTCPGVPSGYCRAVWGNTGTVRWLGEVRTCPRAAI